MANRKQPTPRALPLAEQYTSGVAAASEFDRLRGQLRGLENLQVIADTLDRALGYEIRRDLERIRAALEALVLLTAATSLAPNLREAAVKAATAIAGQMGGRP